MSPLTAQPITATGAARESWPKGSGVAAVVSGRLGPGRAHHDQRHGEQGDDHIEWCGRLDLGAADQELSHRKGKEGADHVNREDPSALRRPGLGVEPTLGRNEDPRAAEPDDPAQDQPWQGPNPERHGRGRGDHEAAERGVGADVPDPLDDPSARNAPRVKPAK